MLVAQAAAAEACGAEGQTNLLCLLVRRVTDDAIALRTAEVLGHVIQIIVVIVVAYALTRIARMIIYRFSVRMERRIKHRLQVGEARGVLQAERYRSRRLQRLHATSGVLRGVVSSTIWLIAILVIIDGLGISMQPVLAGAGVVSVVIGFGAQQLVRDVIAGIAMLIEDQYGVGDWIDIDGVIGQVEKVGLRATSFRDLDGVLHHVLNGHVQRVGNLSQEWSRSILDVPLALDTDVPTAKAVILKVASDLAEDPVWGEDIIGEPEIWGVQDFGPTGLSVRVSMATKPMVNWDINRQMRERLQHAFERANIRMPGQLVEVGGMPTGYALRHEQQAGQTAATARQRQGLVPPDVGPFDRPEDAGVDTERASEADDTLDLDALTPPPPDMTTQLRKVRGREARPE